MSTARGRLLGYKRAADRLGMPETWGLKFSRCRDCRTLQDAFRASPRPTFDTAEVRCDLSRPLVQFVFMLIAGVPYDMKHYWWDSVVPIGTRLPRVLVKRYPIGLLLRDVAASSV
jgi:hypothetical protein